MRSISGRPGFVLAICLAMAAQGVAQAESLTKKRMYTRVAGLVTDFTADLDGVGPWQVVGTWSVLIKWRSGKADVAASLSMVRADTSPRSVHTHHVSLTNGAVTAISNGYRITGEAVITGNGNAAGFSPSPITVDVVGGDTVEFSNVQLTFEGGAVAHFGEEPLDGVVTKAR